MCPFWEVANSNSEMEYIDIELKVTLQRINNPLEQINGRRKRNFGTITNMHLEAQNIYVLMLYSDISSEFEKFGPHLLWNIKLCRWNSNPNCMVIHVYIYFFYLWGGRLLFKLHPTRILHRPIFDVAFIWGLRVSHSINFNAN